jgi:hypothetical protein
MNGFTKLLFGAQTGADRAALDWAIFHDIPHGGWCVKCPCASSCITAKKDTQS